MTNLNEISAQEMGRRLRLARETADVRQEDAAKLIGTSRPTLVSIEKGTRPVRVEELQVLAHHYGLSVNALLRRESVHIDLLPRYRKLRETEDKHTAEAVALLNALVKAEVELENLLGIEGTRRYPAEKGISSGDVIQLAEKHALELRNWLGLGSGPISDLFTLIELDLGIRLYQRRLSSRSKVAGLFAYDPQVGACMLLNANHPLERRAQTAAHEIGHFIGTRQVPEVIELNEQFLSREERYAQAFGRSFLTPKSSIEKAFHNITAGCDKLTRRHVIVLAHQFQISREACVRRLEELDLTRKGTWDWFERNGGITEQNALAVLGSAARRLDPVKDDADRPLSHRMSVMVHAAWKRDLLSESQLAELLNLNRVELRTLIDEIECEESDSDDLLKLPRR